MTAAETALAAAILFQVVFTFAVMVRAGRARYLAIKAGRAGKGADLDAGAWPPEVRQRANNMNNQFETPTLFYALAILALVIGAADWPMAALAGLFLASRVWHSVIHTGSNAVMPRFRAFLVGVAALLAMTGLLAGHLLRGLA